MQPGASIVVTPLSPGAPDNPHDQEEDIDESLLLQLHRARSHVDGIEDFCSNASGVDFVASDSVQGSQPQLHADAIAFNPRSENFGAKAVPHLHWAERGTTSASSVKCSQSAKTSGSSIISIADALEEYSDDISDFIFSLAAAFQHQGDHGEEKIICSWEYHNGQQDTQCYNRSDFHPEIARAAFRAAHQFYQKCFELIPVNFVRPKWGFRPRQWQIGSFVPPSANHAVVACVLYLADGAHYQVATIPKNLHTLELRSFFSVRHGSLVRVNGSL